ncbi:hypothetical protein DFJ73DRAFT_757307 [Zopfochytrium polystomum]|nr:hypothetical protein DFJ73DRAFT_757307 [Zopfochytrium polystomum]
MTHSPPVLQPIASRHYQPAPLLAAPATHAAPQFFVVVPAPHHLAQVTLIPSPHAPIARSFISSTPPPPRYLPLPAAAPTKQEIESATSPPSSSSDGRKSHLERELHRKKAHSAIEKRRRDKLNLLLAELQRLVPACAGRGQMHKLDVLEDTIDHVLELETRLAEARTRQGAAGRKSNNQQQQEQQCQQRTPPCGADSNATALPGSPQHPRSVLLPSPSRPLLAQSNGTSTSAPGPASMENSAAACSSGVSVSSYPPIAGAPGSEPTTARHVAGRATGTGTGTGMAMEKFFPVNNANENATPPPCQKRRSRAGDVNRMWVDGRGEARDRHSDIITVREASAEDESDENDDGSEDIDEEEGEDNSGAGDTAVSNPESNHAHPTSEGGRSPRFVKPEPFGGAAVLDERSRSGMSVLSIGNLLAS